MFIFAIAFAILVASSEIDLIVPSFPELQNAFGLSPFAVELTLSLNLLAHCIAGLFAGNLGDKFGRRQIILYGFVLFIFGSLLGAFAPSFELILLARVLQGIGVAPGIVLGYVVAMEKYPPSEQGRIMGLLNGVLAISLSAAPVFGSYISLYFGYQGNFGFMAITGVLGLIALALFVPNDKQHNKDVGLHLNAYLPVLKNKTTMLYVIWISLIPGAYYSFVGLASLLFVEGLGLSLSQFGVYMGIITFTFGIFSVLSGKIMKLMGRKNAFNASLFCLLGFLFTTLLLVGGLENTPELILFSTLLFAIGCVIPINEGFVLAMESMPEAKGKISGLVSTLKWVITMIGVQTASYFYHGSYTPIAITLFVMISISLLIMIVTYKKDVNFKNAFNNTQSNTQNTLNKESK
jgi:DHA1 family bicyclomycin/chloramphenicol resistance-like MFS transporter